MAPKKKTTKVDPDCPVHGFAVERTGGLVDPACPVHGFALERTGGLEMIRRLETRIEMLEAQLQKKTATKKDVVEARNAIFNRFREAGGAFPSKQDSIKKHKGGKNILGTDTGCVTVGGIKSGTCNFANFEFNADNNIRTKLKILSNAFKLEMDDGCWKDYPSILAVLKFGQERFDKCTQLGLLSTKTGGFCTGIPSSGSYFLGGKKEGTCKFNTQVPKWASINLKLQSLINGLNGERKDGCYKKFFPTEINAAFDDVIRKLLTIKCDESGCKSTDESLNNGPLASAQTGPVINLGNPFPPTKNGGKAKRTYKKRVPAAKPKKAKKAAKKRTVKK